MVPPQYSDIGKAANDLISKDYPTGQTKLEVSTSTDNGIKFTVNGVNTGGKIASEVKAKYSDKSRGLVYTQTWNTANVLGTTIEVEDQLAKGVKLDVNCSLLPAKGTKNAKFGAEYKHAHIFTKSSLDLFKGPTILADAVIGSKGFIVGAETGYDVSEAKVTKYGLALGYIAPLFSASLIASNKLSIFTASYHQKVSSNVEAGAKAVWNSSIKDSTVGIEVGSKYTLDSSAFIKAKVDNSGRMGLGYTQVLREGVKVAFGGLFDTTQLGADVHKVGLQLTFEG